MNNGILNNDYIGIEGAIYPPNRPLEPRMEFSKSPVFFDNIFFLDFNEDGNCILGSSDVAGTFWEGTLLYFKNDHLLRNMDYSGFYIFATASDGKFINKNTIAIAEDTGHINVLTIDEGDNIQSYTSLKTIEHIPQIAVWYDSPRLISCSGRSIDVWDIYNVERKALHSFNNYHLERVNCVDTLQQNQNIFVSGSTDKLSCIWDLRSSDTPSVLYANEFSSINSISWNQVDDNYIAVGTQAGDVYLLDKREPKDFISVHNCFKASINRLCFNRSDELAVCGNTNKVLILNSRDKTLNEIYKNEEHPSYVKDVKWYSDDLYSCGFNKSIIKHKR